MKPRELFEVAVRIIGLIVAMAMLPQILSQLILIFSPPAPFHGLDGASGNISLVFALLLVLLLAILFLFGGKVITRLVYGPEKTK